MNAMDISRKGDGGLAGSGAGAGVPTLLGRKSVLMGMAASMGVVLANVAQPSSAAAATSVYVPTWAPSTAYTLGQQVISPKNDVVTAKVAHKSSAAYATDTVKWVLSSTFVSSGLAGDSVIYVSAGAKASDAKDGLSWGTAKASIGAAVTALGGPGLVMIGGGTHTVTSPLPNVSGVTYRGAGRDSTTINVTVGSLLAPTTDDLSGLFFEGLTANTNDGHLFNFTGAGGIYQSSFKDCAFASNVDGSSVFSLRGTGSFQENLISNCILDRLGTATVPTVDIIDQIGAANANVFSHLTMHSLNCESSPAIRFEAATDGSYAYDNTFDCVVGEQNLGGLIHMYSARGTKILNCQDWDGAANYTGHVIKMDQSATNGLISYDSFVINSGRRGGTLGAGVYDYSGPSAVSRNSTLINVGNSTNHPVVNAADCISDITGLQILDNSILRIASNDVSTITPNYASADGLLLQDGVSGYAGKLLAFRTFGSTQHAATITGAGLIAWGSGTAATDTTLRRSAAGVLQCGQKLTAVGGLGVGNSAAATTPGSVVKKIQVFDAAGASLGYIAVYSTIT
jgi:hypothetical protein